MGIEFFMQNRNGVDVLIPNDVASNIIGAETFRERIVKLYLICPDTPEEWDREELEKIVDSDDKDWADKYKNYTAHFIDKLVPDMKPKEVEKCVEYVVHCRNAKVVFVVKEKVKQLDTKNPE